MQFAPRAPGFRGIEGLALAATSFAALHAVQACSSSTAMSPGEGGAFSITADPVPATTINGVAISSSTRMQLSWVAPAGTSVDRYTAIITELATGDARTESTTGVSLVLTDLKAESQYRVQVAACTDQACAGAVTSRRDFTTPGEVWQLQGTGNTIGGLRRIVSDGNVKIHAFRYGLDAPATLAGKVQLYYGPMQQNAKGLAVGTTSSSASASTPNSYLSFTSQAGNSGLISPSTAATLVQQVATGQAVPLSAAMGGKVRLYFEAGDATGRTRILSLDAQDGYTGLDFNSEASTTCSVFDDYSVGGGCHPTVVLGVEGDAILPNPRIMNARQFKIGYPTQDDWRWNGAAGTFMVFTTDFIAGCSTSQRNHGYAVWNGTSWIVQYVANGGCPKLFRSMQAAHPLHLEGVSYKLYYGDPSDVTGRLPGSQLPFLGPKKLLYASGARTGNPAYVDFEDWESTSVARTLEFRWPDGSVLDARAEGYIDDFSIVAPTGDLSLQVFYLAITDGVVAPFTGVAVLVNP
jgi:hypothetical protein